MNELERKIVFLETELKDKKRIIEYQRALFSVVISAIAIIISLIKIIY